MYFLDRWIVAAGILFLLFCHDHAFADHHVPGVQDVRNYEIVDSGYWSIRPPRDTVSQGVARWVDDDRVLFLGVLAGGKQSSENSGRFAGVLPQLYLWDVRTNKVTAHNFDNPPW